MNTSLLTRPEQHVSLVRPSEITALVQRCLPSWGRSEARRLTATGDTTATSVNTWHPAPRPTRRRANELASSDPRHSARKIRKERFFQKRNLAKSPRSVLDNWRNFYYRPLPLARRP